MKKVWLILCAVMLITALSACKASSVGIIGGADGPTAVFVTGNPDAQIITAVEAEQAALVHAGLTADKVHFHLTELDVDNGVAHYDVEFHTSTMEYEYEIHAETGEVLSFEHDR
ncbi:MAG: PepSY domain-containing protein [Oscillospiraceae bacterium]|nr:PepSY domain-containing protein [Oscillospiraceae bacterium]